LCSGLNSLFFVIRPLSTSGSILKQAQVFGFIALTSLNIHSQNDFLGNQATHLETAAISCLKTKSLRLYFSGLSLLLLIIHLLAKLLAASSSVVEYLTAV